MRKISMKKKTAATLTAGAIVVGGAAGAYAYWTTSGSGTGTATTGTSQSVTVAQVGSISNLTPGSPAQAVDFKITNPASTNQFITSVTVSMTGVTGSNIDASHPCTTDDFTLTQPTVTYGDLTPGAHSYSPSGATLALKNTGSNQDGCKGATVALAFAAN